MAEAIAQLHDGLAHLHHCCLKGRMAELSRPVMAPQHISGLMQYFPDNLAVVLSIRNQEEYCSVQAMLMVVPMHSVQRRLH